MIRRLIQSVERGIQGALAHLTRAARAGIKPKSAIAGLATDLTRTHDELLAENAALRQQVILLSRRTKRLTIKPIDRVVLVLTSALTSSWRDAILVVKPDTILRWHRQGFRLLWRWKSRRRKSPGPKISSETIALIKRMATENVTWGAPRIHGELLKLGIKVAKPTVQRYMDSIRPTGGGQRWSTFLKNHKVWACDFVQTYDWAFRPIFAFFIVDVNKKDVIHVAVTRSPSQAWTAQQLREVTPFGNGANVIIRDRDGKFGEDFDRVAKGVGMRVIRTPRRTPNMNAVCERFIGSVRRECLDHILILNEKHLKSALKEYAFSYFNQARPHQGIEQRTPVPSERKLFRPGAEVIALPVLGGLHHDYRVAA